MSEIYWKSGRSLRLEVAAGAEALVETDERGRALNDGITLRAEPSDAVDRMPPLDVTALLALADGVREAARPAEIERAMVSTGLARHRIERGEVVREWEETSSRLFISMVNRRCAARVSLHLGAGRPQDIGLDDVWNVGHALRKLRKDEKRFRGPLLLSPAVAAELWPALLMRSFGPVRIGQSADPPTIDGHGEDVVAVDRIGSDPQRWPNVFRPSYRIPPRPAPFHLRARPVAAITRPTAIAVGLVTPFVRGAGGVTARLLCSEGEEAFTAEVNIAPEHVVAIGPPSRWYPVGAGSWGSEVLLDAQG